MAPILDDDPFGEQEFVVTEEDVADFKKQILEEVTANPQLYHPKDVEMIKSNYEICRRYVRHKRKDIDAAVDMAKKSLQWRNEFDVNGISESNIYRLYLNVGCFIPFKKDKQGSQCIIFRTKLHRKNAARSHDMKRYMIFWVEKLLYEQNNPRMTFIFDSTDASYSSMDLDQIMFTIQIFNEYYPWALGYVIVYNMPWILKSSTYALKLQFWKFLNLFYSEAPPSRSSEATSEINSANYFAAVWSGIQALIPAEGADRFKFCNGDDIFEYIERDNLPVFMGGSVPTPFRELTSEEIEAIPVDSNIEKRIYSTPAITKFYRDNFGLFAGSADLRNGGDHSQVFACKPENCLSFETINGARVAYLDVTNCSADGQPIAFRVRTNRRDAYSAHPHCGIIDSQASIRISITKLRESPGTNRDKLLVQVVPVDHPQAQVMDIFKKLNRQQVLEKKILCEASFDDEEEADFAYSTIEPMSRTTSLEQQMALLTARCERQQRINIVVCALLVLCLALTLHGKVCQSANVWWCA